MTVCNVEGDTVFATLGYFTVNATSGLSCPWNGLDRTRPGWEQPGSWNWPSREHLLDGYVPGEPWFCKPGDTVEFIQVVTDTRDYHGLRFDVATATVVGSITL